jgi:broad specificity phosphatase PhoE
MTNATLIHFVRHGDVHNPQDVFYGRLEDFPLSDKGRSQAQSAAKVLSRKPIGAIFSSPLLRARQTAEIILAPHSGLTLRISKLLDEVHTPFDGKPRSVVEARNWDVYTGVDRQYEQPMDVLRRAQQFIEEVRRQYSGQHVVAVTHADLIAFLLVWVKGMPVTAESKQALGNLGLPTSYPPPASITTLVYETMASDEVPSFEFVQPG